MRERRVGCLPVVRDGTLVGIVTQRDFMDVARDLLEAKLAGDGVERSDGALDPVDLGDHVPGPLAQGRRREPLERLVEPVGIDLAQGRDPGLGRSRFARRAAFPVLTVGEGVFGLGVDDQQRQGVGGEVERLVGHGAVAAVEQQRVAGDRP